MDCAAQSMDLYFARAIHGLHSTCAIHGLRNHIRVKKKKKGSKTEFMMRVLVAATKMLCIRA